MKLFSPQQSKTNKESENVREMLRATEIQKQADKVRKNLNSAEADFKLSLAKNRDIWALEEETHSKRLKEMVKEVSELEERKKQALIPIEIYKKEASVLMDDVIKRGTELVKRELEIEGLREKLEDRLDSVGEREQNVRLSEQKLILKQQGIDSQANTTIEGNKRLNAQIEVFIEDKKLKEKELKDRETSIILQERTILAERESLKRTEKSLSEWSIRLRDREDTIERTLKRIKPT